MSSLRTKSLLVSSLSMGRPENIERQLDQLPEWLAELRRKTGVTTHLVIRNNAPNVSFQSIAERIDRLGDAYPELKFTLIAGEPNIGFGRGHNANYLFAPADAMLVLNDDIGFPHIDWLVEALRLLENDDRIALVGAQENPQNVSPFFGNGVFPRDYNISTLKYAEASILVANSTAFVQIGMFDHAFEWAMCEDADLSLRVQQHGFKIAWLPMPHEHWRSSTFNSLPVAVRSSVLEHNRAALFASWRQSFASGRIGKYEVFDLWSDGLGDLFCALPHLRAELTRMTPARRRHVVVNTNNPELMKLLGHPDLKIVSFSEHGSLRSAFDEEGISTIRSLRNINYSVPMELHSLVSGALGLSAVGVEGLEEFRSHLRDRITTHDMPDGLKPGAYCVLHLEFLRLGHHGRGMASASSQDLLDSCLEQFETVVLIGNEKRYAGPPDREGGPRIVDLQGKLGPGQLLSLLANAEYFVGIDSYPAHVAQAAGVRSAIFFGSVHPLTRIWNESLVWPLLAPLDCIGCYHGHIEPSTPFCMRLDEACTTHLGSAYLRDMLRAMVAGRPHDWFPQRVRLRELQAKMVKLISYHPAPPERLFRASPTNNEAISNLIYHITDKMSQLLKDQYLNSQVDDLARRKAELEAQNHAKALEIESAAQLRWQYEGELARLRTALRAATMGTRVAYLSELTYEQDRCVLTFNDHWLEVASEDEDPQLFLVPIEGTGGQLRLHVFGIADSDNLLELFWSNMAREFSEERKRSVATIQASVSVDQTFQLAEGERLWIRIDPLVAAGRMRIRGSLSGAFRLSSDGMATPDMGRSHATAAPEFANADALPETPARLRNSSAPARPRVAASRIPRGGVGIVDK